MEAQVAVAKSRKYGTLESGDTLEMIERPMGGLSLVLADGQMSGKAAKAIAGIERLAKERSVASYEQAARQLVDLREALGPDLGPEQARAIAEKLRQENPRLRRLVAALRGQGLLD